MIAKPARTWSGFGRGANTRERAGIHLEPMWSWPGPVCRLRLDLRFFQQMLPAIRAKQRVCATFEEALRACEDAILELELDSELESRFSRHTG